MSSRNNLDLPTPASPITPITCPEPLAAFSQAFFKAAIEFSRPTNLTKPLDIEASNLVRTLLGLFNLKIR